MSYIFPIQPVFEDALDMSTVFNRVCISFKFLATHTILTIKMGTSGI
jgi:hypothetical protein